MARRTNWRDLSNGQRGALAAATVIETALTATAAADLYRRPADQVRGRKALWWLGIFVQPIGSIAYLAWGRRPPA